MIAFHGSPLSGPIDRAGRFYAGRHVMVSYAYPEHIKVIADTCKSFAIDNGAFTTWRQGKQFDLVGYKRFVEEWMYHPSFAFCLIPDIIDGTERENNKLIAEWTWKSKSVPVWHFHERITRLASFVNWWPMVALGSSGKYKTPGEPDWWNRVAEFMPSICNEQGRPYCKLHGLRMLDQDIFTKLPLHSADSTNAAMNAGSISRFKGYTPAEAWARANVIADRIEANQSADCWVFQDKVQQRELLSLEMA